jgi:hypothetical protein
MVVACLPIRPISRAPHSVLRGISRNPLPPGIPPADRRDPSVASTDRLRRKIPVGPACRQLRTIAPIESGDTRIREVFRSVHLQIQPHPPFAAGWATDLASVDKAQHLRSDD